MDQRKKHLEQWIAGLSNLQLLPETLETASADASFRRYFRVESQLVSGGSVILMDAPPPHEDVRPFMQIAQRLWQAGVLVPQVLAADEQLGFLALTDLGQTTYMQALNEQTCHELYQAAWKTLVRMQVGASVDHLPLYDAQRLQAEMQLFIDWYVLKHCQFSLSDVQQNDLKSIFQLLAAQALAQPQVFVHRDYHSRNLMVLDPQRVDVAGWPAGPGVLDFQDAVLGPVTYDLVSLFKDAYIQWDPELCLDWTIRYWEAAKKAGIPVAPDPAEFYRQYEWMGLQRHLKVLGIFARLYHRDGKAGYLNDIPLVLHYTRQVAESFSVFKPLVKILDELEGVEVKVGYTF